MNKHNEGEANTGQLGNYQIQLIGEEEVSTAVRRMKSGKAVVPDKGWTFISGPTFESVDDMRCEGGNRWKGTCVNEREGVVKMDESKYLGSTIHSNGECTRELKKRERGGWSAWR